MEITNTHPILADCDTETILFNNRSKNYAFLSNSYETKIMIDNDIYYHVEGYFHSQKQVVCGSPIVSKQIRNLGSPVACRRISNEYKFNSNKLTLWTDDIQYKIIKRGVLAKFLTNTNLKERLLNTGTSKIVENSLDEYWGCGKVNTGKNIMGIILMEVRNIIKDL